MSKKTHAIFLLPHLPLFSFFFSFLRQYTELVTDKGRCPAQVTLTYAGQPPAVFKEYPFFFGKRSDDDLDLPALMRLSLGPQLPVADEKLASQRTVG